MLGAHPITVTVIWTARGHCGLADRFCHRPFAPEHTASLPRSRLSFPTLSASGLPLAFPLTTCKEHKHKIPNCHGPIRFYLNIYSYLYGTELIALYPSLDNHISTWHLSTSRQAVDDREIYQCKKQCSRFADVSVSPAVTLSHKLFLGTFARSQPQTIRVALVRFLWLFVTALVILVRKVRMFK